MKCFPTLEPQLLNANSVQGLNAIFGTAHPGAIELLEYMHANKTDCALKILSSKQRITYPQYILDAIKQ